MKQLGNNDKSYITSIDWLKTPKGTAKGFKMYIYYPLLFVVYINDIPELDNLAHFILYADDANIIVTADTIDELHSKTNKLLESLKCWVDNNGLSINVKTQYMIFSRTKGRLHLPKPLNFNNKNIEHVTEAKFLGAIVDNRLNWAQHIESIISKISR